MKRLILILLALLWALSLQASDVLIDSVPTAVLDTTAPYTLASVVIGNNPNRLLVVGVTQREPNINNVTGCTFNTSETMTKLTSLDGLSTANLNVSVWYLVAPSVTTASVVCTVTNNADMVLGAYSLYSASQAGAGSFRDTDSTAVSATTTDTLTVDSIAGDLVLAFQMAGNSASNVTNLVPSGSQVEKWDVANGGLNFARGGSSSLLASSSSTVMAYTWTNNEHGVLIATSVQPALSAGTLFKRYYDMLRSSLLAPRLRFQG